MSDLNTFRLIERISTLLRSEERKKYAAIGLLPVHVQILDYLAKCNRHSDTPASVSEYLGLTKGTVSQSLQLLERKGYLLKTSDARDGRVVHLSLSKDGVALVEQMQPLEVFALAEQALIQQNFSNLDEALQATLSALQQANQSKSFGLCHSCQHFSSTDTGYHCQLTHLPLTETESEKICREHIPA